ncbi:hypothetical protein BC937DRAFT_93262 [Endogone sp. FLAS-F59071]|nr:hypothetical protein BC937DRAFT_93262 [Endogone sp. FLAS-F59071]|eukprot:RUS21239.1 hypothetical protein BC937DRAFT_93262 [Endogone sp. FLAS-F59071]
MGLVHPGTILGTLLRMIGSRNTVPLRILRIVPLGDLHICLSLNSSTRASSGVMVAHLMPTLYFLIASAASIVTRSSVYRGRKRMYNYAEILMGINSFCLLDRGATDSITFMAFSKLIHHPDSPYRGRTLRFDIAASNANKNASYRLLTLSLIICQMIRVISSPSRSTTGFLTTMRLSWVSAIGVNHGRSGGQTPLAREHVVRPEGGGNGSPDTEGQRHE